MFINKYTIGLAAITLLLACSQTNQQAEQNTAEVNTNAAKVNLNKVSFKDEKLNLIYTDYLKLKDALVATNFSEASQAAENLNQSLAQSDKSLLSDVNQIAKAKNIEEQRKTFTTLSNNLILLFKKSELTSGVVYVQHCPMANQGEGGDWLSSDQKIQNPYYGNEMMECGAVLEEMKSGKK